MGYCWTGSCDGDGKVDILWQHMPTGTRIIWLMNGISYSSTVNLGIFQMAWKIAAVGNIDGDGYNDILWQNSFTGARLVWLMNGTTYYGGGVGLGNYPIALSIAGTGASMVITEWIFSGRILPLETAASP